MMVDMNLGLRLGIGLEQIRIRRIVSNMFDRKQLRWNMTDASTRRNMSVDAVRARKD